MFLKLLKNDTQNECINNIYTLEKKTRKTYIFFSPLFAQRGAGGGTHPKSDENKWADLIEVEIVMIVIVNDLFCVLYIICIIYI